MNITKPFGAMASTARETVRHPVDTGLKVVGRTIGVARGSAVAVVRVFSGDRSRPATDEPAEQPTEASPRRTDADLLDRDIPQPETRTPQDLPTPADLAARIDPGDDVTTPVGTPGAGTAQNPDTVETDLQQPGTEPLMDPSTTKAVASESEMLRKAADPNL